MHRRFFQLLSTRSARLVVLLLGAAAVVALLGVDPAVAALLLDVDFLVLLGSVGLALTWSELRLLGHVIGASTTAQYVRAGVVVTRGDPWTLLAR
jgi:hypothetical protein